MLSLTLEVLILLLYRKYLECRVVLVSVSVLNKKAEPLVSVQTNYFPSSPLWGGG
jgi:hypothetical protein